jgi:hypothetical protein
MNGNGIMAKWMGVTNGSAGNMGEWTADTSSGTGEANGAEGKGFAYG